MKTSQVQVIGGEKILVADEAAAKGLKGKTVWLATHMAHEKAEYTVENVTRNKETGDWSAWVVRAGEVGGKHARIVFKA